jgi:hypothetical protein
MAREEKHIQSEQVEDLLSKIPNWITRWGISLICLILFFVIFISNFIIYPDVIRGKLVVQNINADTTICRFEIPQEQIYRIKSGEELILKFERFPFQKFGIVKSQILCTSDSVINGYLLYKIQLHKLAKTSSNQQIRIYGGMAADCEIIVEKRSTLKMLLSFITNNHE